MNEYICCPFCEERDFDLIGLKEHYLKGYCQVFNDTSAVTFGNMNEPSVETLKQLTQGEE